MPQGEASTIVVRGESGIGKTVLVRRFLDTLEGDAAHPVVLEGQCRENEWIPFKAFDGIMDGIAHVLSTSRDEAAKLLPANAERLAQAFPVLRELSPPAPRTKAAVTDPMEQRGQLFAAVRDLFARLAERYPIVVVIDDLQWADADSLALLGEVTRPPHAPPILLVVTVRVGAADVLRLPALSRARVLDLGRLSTEESITLARELAQAHDDAVTQDAPGESSMDAGAIAREAAGHPMFIAELARYSVATQDARPALKLDDVLWERALRLDATSRDVLALVCVAGAPRTIETIGRAAGGAGEAIARAVLALQATHLVRASGARARDTIEPYHDRMREAVVARLDDDERRRLHGRLAEAIEAIEPDLEALAAHWEAARDVDRAKRYAVLAAEHAADVSAFDRAAGWYEHALALAREPAERRALHAKLGEALADSGRGALAADAFLAAADGAPPDEALDFRRRGAEQLLRCGHHDRGLVAARGVLGTLGLHLPRSPHVALLMLVFLRVVIAIRGLDFQTRREDDVAPRTLTRIDTTWSLGFCLTMSDHILGQLFIARALLLALRAGEPLRVARSLVPEIVFQATRGGRSWPRALALTVRTMALAESTQDPVVVASAVISTGIAHYLNGHFTAGIERLDAGLARVVGGRLAGAAYEMTLGQIYLLVSLLYLGRLPELVARQDEFLRKARDRGDVFATVNLRIGYSAFAWLVQDDPATARGRVTEAMRQWSADNFHLEHLYGSSRSPTWTCTKGTCEGPTRGSPRDGPRSGARCCAGRSRSASAPPISAGARRSRSRSAGSTSRAGSRWPSATRARSCASAPRGAIRSRRCSVPGSRACAGATPRPRQAPATPRRRSTPRTWRCTPRSRDAPRASRSEGRRGARSSSRRTRGSRGEASRAPSASSRCSRRGSGVAERRAARAPSRAVVVDVVEIEVGAERARVGDVPRPAPPTARLNVMIASGPFPSRRGSRST